MRAAQLLRRQVLGNVVHSEPSAVQPDSSSVRVAPTRDESIGVDELYVVGRGDG